MKPAPMARDQIDAINDGMCGEREFYDVFAQAIIDARDAQWEALHKPRNHVEQFTRMAQARKDTDAFQALIDKGQPL